MTKTATSLLRAKHIGWARQDKTRKAMERVGEMIDGPSIDFDGRVFAKVKAANYRSQDKNVKTQQMVKDKFGKKTRHLVDSVKGFFSGAKKSVKKKGATAKEYLNKSPQPAPAMAMA